MFEHISRYIRLNSFFVHYRNVIILLVLLLLSEFAMAQTPIMIITCKGRRAMLVGNENPNAKIKSDEALNKAFLDKTLKNAGVMMPDCSLASCLSCDLTFSGGLFWEPLTESCECFVDVGDEPVPVTYSPEEDCNCPEGTVEATTDINNDGIFETTCAFPVCYEGEYTSMIECGQDDLIIDVELCAASGADAEGSVLVVESLVGCEFVSINSFDLLSQGGNTVGLGPADENGCIQFQIVLDAANAPATISFDGAETLDLEIPVCPTISDPCSCDKLFSNEPPLFSDELSIMGLPAGAQVMLSSTYPLSGFKDNASMTFAPGTSLGTVDAFGNMTFPFYRGSEEVADIEVVWSTTSPNRTGTISFTSSEPCPLFEDCDPLPPAIIPTLSEWGLVSLALLLMIVGIARIRSMEQAPLEAMS